MNRNSEQEYYFQSQTVESTRNLARANNRLVRKIEKLLLVYLFVPPVITSILLCLLHHFGQSQVSFLVVAVCFLFYILFAIFLIKRIRLEASAKINSLLPLLADFSHELSSPLVTLGGIINTIGSIESNDRSEAREASISDLLARLRHCHRRISSLHQDLRVLASWGEPLKHSELSVFNLVRLVQTCIAEIKERCDEKGILIEFSVAADSASSFISSASSISPASPGASPSADSSPSTDSSSSSSSSGTSISSDSGAPPSFPSTVMVADRDAIARVLINLLENAWKYCPVGSTITVKVSGGRDNVKIEVSDNGPGLPPEILQRIFERKYRGVGCGPGVPSGSGLGISIAREIVECHGGHLTVEPATPMGLKFTVSLPSLPQRHPFMQLLDRSRG